MFQPRCVVCLGVPAAKTNVCIAVTGAGILATVAGATERSKPKACELWRAARPAVPTSRQLRYTILQQSSRTQPERKTRQLVEGACDRRS